MQPPPWWGAPPSHAPDANAHQQPAVQFQQEPPYAQQPKAGMLPPNQQPRPPPLQAAQGHSPTGTATHTEFVVKGVATKKWHPFALQFGGALRKEMSRLYDDDTGPGKAHAMSICRPAISAIRRASGDARICDKWITTGRCKPNDCSNLHPDWSPEWDGAWLHQHCPELAALSKVPITWRSTWHDATARGDGGHLGLPVKQPTPLDTDEPTIAQTTDTSNASSAQPQQQEDNHPQGWKSLEDRLPRSWF